MKRLFAAFCLFWLGLSALSAAGFPLVPEEERPSALMKREAQAGSPDFQDFRVLFWVHQGGGEVWLRSRVDECACSRD